MKRLLTVTCLLVVLLTTLGATDVSPFVRRLLLNCRQSSRVPVHRAVAGEAHREPSLCAFVDVDGADARRVLSAAGCRLLAESGGVAVVEIPLAQLDALTHVDAVRRIEASPVGRCLMDTTRQLVGAQLAFEGRALPQAFSGAGVLLGVVDVGFDLSHPTFLSRDGLSRRIVSLWDQLSTDTVGSQLVVGRDYHFPADNLSSTRDGHDQTHGTHTAGIAAGSGFDGNGLSPYGGMAPDADLCLVANVVSDNAVLVDSLDTWRYTTATDALAFKYIFDCADSLRRPCVISLSEGYPPAYESDDRLYQRFLEGLLGPGRIIVAAAGNNDVRRNYLPKPAGVEAVGATLDVKGDVAVILRSAADVRLGLNLPDDAYSRRYQSTAIPLSQTGLLDSLTFLSDTLSSAQGRLTCQMARFPSAVVEGDTIVYLTLHTDPSLSCRVVLIIEGDGLEAEAWSYGADFAADATQPWNDATHGRNIHCPAAFSRIIAVGATAHRTSFTNYLGDHFDYAESGSGGRRAVYSSVGPTVGGLIKPDVCAPGNNVVSGYSSYYLEAHPDARDIRSDVAHFQHAGRTYAWNANTGTSMAAPVVAGAVALWLEANPMLTPEDVTDLLAHTCRQPEPSLDYPNSQYGYGEIDVYGGLLRLLGLDRLDAVSQRQPAAVCVMLTADRRLRLSFAGQAVPASVDVSLYDLSGRRLWQHLEQPAADVMTLPLPPLRQGVYAVQIDAPVESQRGSTLIRIN